MSSFPLPCVFREWYGKLDTLVYDPWYSWVSCCFPALMHHRRLTSFGIIPRGPWHAGEARQAHFATAFHRWYRWGRAAFQNVLGNLVSDIGSWWKKSCEDQFRKVVYSTIQRRFLASPFLLHRRWRRNYFLYQPTLLCFFIPPNWMVWKSGTIDVQREGWRGISRHRLDKMWSALKSQNQFPSLQLKMHHQTRWCSPWIYSFGFKMDGQMEASISYLWSAIHFYCRCLVQYGICIEGSCCTCAPLRESMTVWPHFESMWVRLHERNLATHNI